MECIIKQSEYDGPKILLKALEAFEYSRFFKLDSQAIVKVGDKTVLVDNATVTVKVEHPCIVEIH